jgi:hypothetical protein
MSSQKHNATGRSHQPSKAERQAAMRQNLPKPEPKPESKVDDETKAEITKELAESKTPAPAPTKPELKVNVPAVKVADPNKGAATRERWAKCLKARPGATLVMASDIKLLPRDSIITSLSVGNPKKRGSQYRYELYGFNGLKGATCTIHKYVEAVKKTQRESSTESVAIADIAWDINHDFIKVEVTVDRPVNEKDPADIAVTAHEVERKVEAESEQEQVESEAA